MKLEEFMEKIQELVIELKIGVCPVYQCGGILEYLDDRINWQEPDLKCKNCGALWKLQKRIDGKLID